MLKYFCIHINFIASKSDRYAYDQSGDCRGSAALILDITVSQLMVSLNLASPLPDKMPRYQLDQQRSCRDTVAYFSVRINKRND